MFNSKEKELEKFDLSGINLKDQKRVEIIKCIKWLKLKKDFDVNDFFESVTKADYKYLKPSKVVYVAYPPRDWQAKDDGVFPFNKIIDLMENFSILRQYMKWNLSIGSTKKPYLEEDFLMARDRMKLGKTSFLSWDVLQIMLNIFRDNDETNNIAIINGYIIKVCKNTSQDIRKQQMLDKEMYVKNMAVVI